MPQYAYVHICHTQPYKWNAPSCYSSTAAFNNCYSELMPYAALANSYELLSTMHTNAKAMPINDNDYICHITAVELV